MTAMVPVTATLRLPCVVAGLQLMRAIADQTLAANRVDDDCRYDIMSAATEACGNVVRHAGALDEYLFTMSLAGETCTVAVRDEGVGFVVSGQQPARPVGDAPSGRGLYLITQLADHLEVDSQPGRGTTVRFTRKLTFNH